MPLYREDAGSLVEIGKIYREQSGSLVELDALYREQSGSLTQIYSAVSVSAETLLPTGDVSSTNWNDTGGDNNGDLWDEMDESPHDGDTTYAETSVQVGTGTTEADFEVQLEAATETHSDSQTHTVVATVKAVESGAISAQSVVMDRIALFNGGTLVAEDTTTRGLGTGSYGTESATLDVSGLSDWSDLHIVIETQIDGQSDGLDQSETTIRCTQVRLDIT